MHKPPRPGAIIKDEVLAPLNLSIDEAADRLAMSRIADIEFEPPSVSIEVHTKQ